MSTTNRKSATNKVVTVIARYQFKADPRKVAYLVRASNGVDTYQVFFFAGRATSCQCASRKPCYHMTQLEQVEAQTQPERVERHSKREQERALVVSEDCESFGMPYRDCVKSIEIARKNMRTPLSADEQHDLENSCAWMEAIDDEGKHKDWAADELAVLGNNKHGLPPRMPESQTPIAFNGMQRFFPNR